MSEMSDIKAKTLDIQKLVEYQDDTVVSREVIKKELGTVTFFAFDQGQGLSEHSAPFDAMVQPKLQFPALKILSKKVKSLLCLLMNLMLFRQLTVHTK